MSQFFKDLNGDGIDKLRIYQGALLGLWGGVGVILFHGYKNVNLIEIILYAIPFIAILFFGYVIRRRRRMKSRF